MVVKLLDQAVPKNNYFKIWLYWLCSDRFLF